MQLKQIDINSYLRKDAYVVAFLDGSYCHELSSKELQLKDQYDGSLFVSLSRDDENESLIQLLYIYSSHGGEFSSNVTLHIEKLANVNVIFEQIFFNDNNSVNSFLDIIVNSGGRCNVTDVCCNIGNNDVSNKISVAVEGDGSFNYTGFSTGAKLFRNEITVDLLNNNASTNLKGGWLLDTNKSIVTSVCVSHFAPNTRSNQHYKGVLCDKSKSFFESTVCINSVAQGAQSRQINNNLVVDDGVASISKPNLKIFADDVKASHGVTISNIDEDELFYMASRGIDLKTAKQYIIKGFLSEIRYDNEV